NNGIYLARHHRRTWLQARKDYLGQTTARSRRQEPHVIGNFHEIDGQRLESGAGPHKGMSATEGLEVVLCGTKRQTGDTVYSRQRPSGELRMGIEPGADGGAPLG